MGEEGCERPFINGQQFSSAQNKFYFLARGNIRVFGGMEGEKHRQSMAAGIQPTLRLPPKSLEGTAAKKQEPDASMSVQCHLMRLQVLNPTRFIGRQLYLTHAYRLIS